MDWENERYVRVYTRDTIDWVALGWEAQALFLMLIRKVDRSGVLEVGKHGARGLAGLIGMPVDVVERALAVLVGDGCVTIRDGVLLIPNFIEAQEAKQSDKQRQKECRDKRRKGAMSHPVTEPSRNVTEGHSQSQPVTIGHSLSPQPSLSSQSNQPSQPGDPPARDLCSTDTAVAAPQPEDVGPVLPNTPDRLVHCLKVAMEKGRPELGMWHGGSFATREAQALLSSIGDKATAEREIPRKIAAFVADPTMHPWTMRKFCDQYNGIGVERQQHTNAQKPPVRANWGKPVTMADVARAQKGNANAG